MCQKCQDRIVKTQQVINEVGAENIVEMLSAVVGNESISPLERFASVMEFGSIFKEPIEVLSIAHYFGGEYLAEKDRSKKTSGDAGDAQRTEIFACRQQS